MHFMLQNMAVRSRLH